jgi:RNA polymerase sigma-70 factor (ECF subfamily)
LLRRAQAGDSHAANRLFDRYVPRLLRWAHKRVPLWARGPQDTHDLVQDAVLHGLQHLQTFVPEREGALLGYLRRALLNRIRDQFRRAARHPAAAELGDACTDPTASPLDRAIDEEDRRRYVAALKRLRSADRNAIVARIELGYSYEQLALTLGKPTPEAARLAIRRALLRLSAEMRRAER